MHYYFDQESGCWVRIPIAWELKHDLVKTLLSPIEDAFPDWSDKFDMLAALRASNYDPHDCMATYMAYGDTGGSLSAGHTAQGAAAMEKAEHDVKDLQQRVDQLASELKQTKQKLTEEQKQKTAAQGECKELRTRVSGLEADIGKSHATIESYKHQVTATEVSLRTHWLTLQIISRCN